MGVRASLQEHPHAAVELQGAGLGLGTEHEIKRISWYNWSSWRDSHLEAGERFKEGLVLLQRGSQRCVCVWGKGDCSGLCVSWVQCCFCHKDKAQTSRESMAWAMVKVGYGTIFCCELTEAVDGQQIDSAPYQLYSLWGWPACDVWRRNWSPTVVGWASGWCVRPVVGWGIKARRFLLPSSNNSHKDLSLTGGIWAEELNNFCHFF